MPNACLTPHRHGWRVTFDQNLSHHTSSIGHQASDLTVRPPRGVRILVGNARAETRAPGTHPWADQQGRMTDTRQKTGDLVLERTEKQTKEPARFKVLLINDDYTTMDFVVEVLETVFHKTPAEAFRIMMQVHTQGKGLCGVYTFEVAETKVEAVHELARQNGYPLRASLEEE